MKRFLFFIVLAAVAVLAVLFALRHHAGAGQSAVANLLPADTAVFVHLPDLEKSRDAWHQTDLYALAREPAVQEFLRKPKAQIPKQTGVTETRRDISALRVHDAFLATNSFDALRVIAGFEFRCDEKQAAGIIEHWKARAMRSMRNPQRSATDYQSHQIDSITDGNDAVASTIAGHRFVIATNVEDLKALLDRMDGRVKTPALDSDNNFRATMKQMPANYAVALYFQPKLLVQKLIALRTKAGVSLPAGQKTALENIQGFAYATHFDGGKIRDTGFMLMPKLTSGNLARETLPLASAETFLYLASMLNLEQQLDMISQSGSPSPWEKLTETLKNAGLSIDDLKAAFGDELSLLLSWPEKARIPTGVVTLAVRDAARANKIVAALTASSGWQASSRNNAQYYLAPSLGSLIAFNPMLAVSNRQLVFGFDNASVDEVVSQKAAAAPLSSADAFRAASKLVADPQQSFAYLNLPQLYTRLDATLRPFLQMSAAFVPGLSDKVDMQKFPAPEVITRHLSPIVASSVYSDNGYRSESVGTVTIGQAATVGVAGYAALTIFKYQSAVKNSGSWQANPPTVPNIPPPAISPATPGVMSSPIPLATPTP